MSRENGNRRSDQETNAGSLGSIPLIVINQSINHPEDSIDHEPWLIDGDIVPHGLGRDVGAVG